MNNEVRNWDITMNHLNMNRWQNIIRYPDYQIRVKNGVIQIRSPTLHILTPTLDDSTGYLVVMLTNANGRRVKEYVHRLTAWQYVTNNNRLENTFVNHVNHNKTDNDIQNLDWVSPKQNGEDKGFRHGVAVEILSLDDFWDEHPNAEIIYEHNNIEFNNLLFCPDVGNEAFYTLMDWNNNCYRCTTLYRNGNRYIKAKDNDGKCRNISFNKFIRERNA
jgi:hypothetical protein